MAAIRTHHLNALAKRRVRIMRQQQPETVAAQQYPLGLSLLRLDPWESGQVADAVAGRVDEPETAVADEVVGVFEGAQGSPF